MVVCAVITMRTLVQALGVVFVRPAVRVGVAQRAMKVQVAFDELVGGEGHGPAG